MKPTSRTISLALFIACAGLIAGGLFLQHVKHLEPCAMCILQRYAFVLIGLTGLLAALHNPRGTGARLYALVMLLLSLTGGGVAARQAWMQRFPTHEMECGPGLDYMLQSFPVADALPMIFKGGGDCAKVEWTFLGGTIPEWSLVWFVIFCATAIYLLWQPRSQSRR